MNDLSITIHRDPSPDGYQQAFVARGGARLSPRAFPEFVLTVDEILP